MIYFLKKLPRKALHRFGLDIIRLSKSGHGLFLRDHFQRLNQRRLEHLACLGLDIAGSTVLEVGAGIGEHTSFFLDRNCQITTSDAREEHVKMLRSRYPSIRVLQINLDTPPKMFNESFDIVYCYGVLYHLGNPFTAIEFMSNCCRKMLLLETCISFGDEDSINLITEDAIDPRRSITGVGCRPTRSWIFNELKKYFEFVYLPITQPNHEEYPIDWTNARSKTTRNRAIFIASQQKINNRLLVEEIPIKQIRH